ncbi:MAG: phosphoribosylformylglycinamidine cyclo-ligase [Pseudanabaenaceae cyanobacterium]
MDYRSAGVDIEAGRDFVRRIRQFVEDTYRPEVLGGLGGFSGCFQVPTGYREPVLVAGTDGVGTKLKIAQACNAHRTIGIDLVAMCVNDVLTAGAEPLFFLDYVATGKLHSAQLVEVVEGIAVGCQQAGCALIGGETAEMPGFYQQGEYDLAGFCVGIAEKSKLLNGSQVRVGDAIVGIASTGLHSNGFSLVRKIISSAGYQWYDPSPLDASKTIGADCLTPTRIYVSLILPLIKGEWQIHGLAHITGGGLPENLPRCLGAGQSARIYPNSWTVPEIFLWLQELGKVETQEMFNTFNMGIGLAVVIDPAETTKLLNHCNQQGIPAWPIGEVVSGDFGLAMV